MTELAIELEELVKLLKAIAAPPAPEVPDQGHGLTHDQVPAQTHGLYPSDEAPKTKAPPRSPKEGRPLPLL